MKMRIYPKLAYVILLVLLTTAAAISQHEHSDKSQKQHGQTGMKDAPYDLQFIDTMSMHHQHGIDMAKMAVSKANSAELRELAKKMVSGQQKDIAQLKSWRDQWYPKMPKAMNMQMHGMSHSSHQDMMKEMGEHMSKLKKATGPAFDTAFIETIIPHHQQAIQMSRDALQKAEHAEIKTFAQKTIDAQQKEIDELSRLKSK
jgi:uncharacterized protein (DUF305 family)